MKGEIDPPYLKLHILEWIEPFARKADVSHTGMSSRGFLAAYKLASGEPSMMGRNPSSGHLWADERTRLINRHYAQARQNREKFWKNGLPTRRHLMLMMCQLLKFLMVWRHLKELQYRRAMMWSAWRLM